MESDFYWPYPIKNYSYWAGVSFRPRAPPTSHLLLGSDVDPGDHHGPLRLERPSPNHHVPAVLAQLAQSGGVPVLARKFLVAHVAGVADRCPLRDTIVVVGGNKGDVVEGVYVTGTPVLWHVIALPNVVCEYHVTVLRYLEAFYQ